MVIFVINGNFVGKGNICQEWQFLLELAIFTSNGNFCQEFQYVVMNGNIGQK
jgi:hypothetical protein